MKRDIDLIRAVLFAVEKEQRATGHGFMFLNVDGYPKDEVSYHVNLLHEAGMIDAVDLSSLANYRWEPRRLTLQGHEFLDLARSDNLWEKAKKELRETGSFSFQTLRDRLIRLAAETVQKNTPAANKPTVDFRESLAKVKDEYAHSLFQKALECYEHRLYPPAILMSWMAAVYILYKHVCDRYLDEFNREAKRKDSSWRAAKTIDDFGRMKERVFLDRIESLSIISRSTKSQLGTCLDQRNICSHPSVVLVITETIAAAHLEKLCLSVFDNPQFMVAHRNRKTVTTELIQKEVSAFFGLTVRQLKSSRRTKKISEARQIAMYLSRKHTSYSFPEIAKKFGGKNHSTVVHAAKKIKGKIKQDQNMLDAVSKLSVQIEGTRQI